MIEILNFLFSQIGNIISFLDSWEIIENLSFFKLFVIIILFRFVFKFLLPKGGEN